MSFKDEIKRASQGTSDFDPPDGHHKVKIVDGGAFAGGDGRRWVKVTLQLLEGEHAGKTFDDFNGWDQEVGQRIIYANLSVYGIKWDTIDEFEDLELALLELHGTEAVVTVKHSRGGYVNVTAATAKARDPELPGQESFQTAQPVPAAPSRYGQTPDEDDNDPIPF